MRWWGGRRKGEERERGEKEGGWRETEVRGKEERRGEGRWREWGMRQENCLDAAVNHLTNPLPWQLYGKLPNTLNHH